MEKKNTGKTGKGKAKAEAAKIKKAAEKKEKEEQEKVKPEVETTGAGPEPENTSEQVQEAPDPEDPEKLEEVKTEDTEAPPEQVSEEKSFIDEVLEALPVAKVKQHIAEQEKKAPDFRHKKLSEEDIKAIAVKLTPEEFMALPDKVQDYLLSLDPKEEPASAQVDIKEIILPDWFMVYPENGEVYRIPTRFALSEIQKKNVVLVNQKTGESKAAIELISAAENSLTAEALFIEAVSALDWSDLRVRAQRLAQAKHLSLQESFPTARKSFVKVK